VGVVRQKIRCLPHGNATNRNYTDRHKFLASFNPQKDLYLNKDNVYELSQDCMELRENLINYFQTRNKETLVENVKWITCKTRKGTGFMTKILGLSGKKQSGKDTACNCLFAATISSLKVASYAKINERGQIVVPADIDGEVKEGVLDIDNPQVKQFLEEMGVHKFVKQYSFADTLKQFCINVLGLDYKACYGTNEEKDAPTTLLWENMPGIITENTAKYLRINSKDEQIIADKCLQFNSLYHKSGLMSGREVMQWFGTDICRKIFSDCWVKDTIQIIHKEAPLLAVIRDVRFPNECEAIQKGGGKVLRLTRCPIEGDVHSSESKLDDYTGFDRILDNSQMSIEEQDKAIKDILVEWKWDLLTIK